MNRIIHSITKTTHQETEMSKQEENEKTNGFKDQ